VTGRSRYAEDYRVEGMLFAKLLLSPMPHARVLKIDASEALKMPGVHGILTADELIDAAPPVRGTAAAEEEELAAVGEERDGEGEQGFEGTWIEVREEDDEFVSVETSGAAAPVGRDVNQDLAGVGFGRDVHRGAVDDRAQLNVLKKVCG